MTDDTTTRALYDTRALAATFRATRALPVATVQLWIDTFRRALNGIDVRLAVDVGAGTGRFTTVLAAAVTGRVIAVEPIAAMAAEREPSAAVYVRGIAEALPLRSGAVDAAVMSMVYHQLRDGAPAAAELRRVVRRGGIVLLRTTTQENGGDVRWLRFFPEVGDGNVGRMPAEDAIVEIFTAARFACREREIVRQRIADDMADYLERIRRRPFSSLRALPEEIWTRRLAEFERYCRTAPDEPVVEPVTLFVFQAL